jgi:hypothetical protein
VAWCHAQIADKGGPFGGIGYAELDSVGETAMLLFRKSDFPTFRKTIIMPTLIKIHKKGQMTLPTRLRSQAGIGDGDLVDATFSGQNYSDAQNRHRPL